MSFCLPITTFPTLRFFQIIRETVKLPAAATTLSPSVSLPTGRDGLRLHQDRLEDIGTAGC
jgi:hypothetical protein